ncbi:MAG: diguanylate cyclase [Deltaproteobacteria bacterium]|nr:diguanylate cyclase [Deltaproteobacteria bacterium]
MRKWGLDKSDLPPGSIVRYEEFSFWDLYKWRLILFAFLLVVAVVGYIKVRTRAYEKRLKEKERIQKHLERQVEERTAGLQAANTELARLSNIDGLTSLYNRRFLDAKLEDEWKRHLRSGSPLSMLLCDLDYFKQFNDNYGHQAGDNCLVAVAQAIKKVLKRPSDIGARYGGEEFALLLINTDLDGALKIARDIQEAIHDLAIPHEASRVAPLVTISIGVVSMIPQRQGEADALVLLADQALYQSKHGGRNRIEMIDPRSQG